MTKKIIAFGASNSQNSINKKLVEFASNQLESIDTAVLDLNDFELPIYSPDVERTSGVPANAVQFSRIIQESDGVIISLAEYNGLYTSAFKNLWDWLSRVDTPKVWHDKPMLLLGTSPSRREGSYVMKVSQELFPLFGANIIASFHLPSFNHFFDAGQIIEPKQKETFNTSLNIFRNYIINN